MLGTGTAERCCCETLMALLAVEGGEGGIGVGHASNTEGGPQSPARKLREGSGRGGGLRGTTGEQSRQERGRGGRRVVMNPE